MSNTLTNVKDIKVAQRALMPFTANLLPVTAFATNFGPQQADKGDTVRVARGHADLILGCDLVTSGSERILAAASRVKTHAVVNSHEVMPANFTHDANFDVQGQALTLRIAAAVQPGGFSAIDATDIATKLMGDSIAANLFTLGYAWQKGLVPLTRESIAEAVQLNAVSVKMNLAAFAWGRRAAQNTRQQSVRAQAGVCMRHTSWQTRAGERKQARRCFVGGQCPPA